MNNNKFHRVVNSQKRQVSQVTNLSFFCSLISRILYYVAIYLGLLSPKGSSDLPTGSDGPPFRFAKQTCTGIFGLAAHKVYPLFVSPRKTVSSYLTFSPLPLQQHCMGGNFLWHLL